MSDDIRLVIDGKDFTGWKTVSIDMAIDQLADSFTLSAPFNASDPAIVAAFEEFKYQPFELYMGKEKLMKGRIDVVSKSFDRNGASLSVAGRSLPGPLMDVSIDGQLEWAGISLSTIAKNLISKYGLKTRIDAPQLANKPLELARASFGQTIGSFLNAIAAPRNILLNSSYEGELILSSGFDLINKPAVGAFVEGRAPLISVSSTANGQTRFSDFLIASQFAGEPNVTSTSKDPSIPFYRPNFSVVSETDQDPANTANRKRLESLLASYNVTAEISGWRTQAGERWSERKIVTLTAPSAGIPVETRYLVAGLKHTLSADQKTTSFRLVLPETFSGKMPERYPWD